MSDKEFYTCKNCGVEFPSKEIRLYCKLCKANLEKTGELPEVFNVSRRSNEEES
jgi:hypothetical protein